MKKEKKSNLSGHILMMSVMTLTLLLPLAVILGSYMDMLDGQSIGMFITSVAVVFSGIYIIGGNILMAFQDKEDGQNNK
jgi:uncharacterized membrane protein